MHVSDAPSGTVTSGILSSRDTRTSLYIAGTDEGEAGRRREREPLEKLAWAMRMSNAPGMCAINCACEALLRQSR